jgi:phage baseplate assembly protein W
MGSLNISFGPIDEEKNRGYTWRDFDIVITQAEGNKDIDTLSDLAAIQQGLSNIFTWTQGERILLPEFGNRIRALLYEPINQKTINDVGTELRTLINRWEPRVLVDRIIVDTDPDDPHALIVTLEFSIPSLSQQQFVFTQFITGDVGVI